MNYHKSIYSLTHFGLGQLALYIAVIQNIKLQIYLVQTFNFAKSNLYTYYLTPRYRMNEKQQNQVMKTNNFSILFLYWLVLIYTKYFWTILLIEQNKHEKFVASLFGSLCGSIGIIQPFWSSLYLWLQYWTSQNNNFCFSRSSKRKKENFKNNFCRT